MIPLNLEKGNSISHKPGHTKNFSIGKTNESSRNFISNLSRKTSVSLKSKMNVLKQNSEVLLSKIENKFESNFKNAYSSPAIFSYHSENTKKSVQTPKHVTPLFDLTVPRPNTVEPELIFSSQNILPILSTEK
ncbi:hypothetical protein HZS_2013, partial [Henneguya salminicola]